MAFFGFFGTARSWNCCSQYALIRFTVFLRGLIRFFLDIGRIAQKKKRKIENTSKK
jgi:hypothetical protein